MGCKFSPEELAVFGVKAFKSKNNSKSKIKSNDNSMKSNKTVDDNDDDIDNEDIDTTQRDVNGVHCFIRKSKLESVEDPEVKRYASIGRITVGDGKKGEEVKEVGKNIEV